ncbi:MAG: SHOCT domain-containing protein [Ilumatobacter sp.]
MRRRMGRPGLLGTMARTAVIAGTANATANAMNRRGAQRQAAATQEQAAQDAAFTAQAELADVQAQMAAQQAAPAPASGDDIIAKLKQLAELRDAGVLDPDEFAAAKAKLLG